MSIEQAKNKREIILEAIRAGGATRESLMAAADVNKAGLASQLSYLNTRGMNIAEVDPSRAEFPILRDGVFFMGTMADYEAKTSNAPKGVKKVKTIAQVLEDAQKREDKASVAYDRAQKRVQDTPGDNILETIAEIRRLEMTLASMKLSAVQNGDYSYEGVTVVESEADLPEMPEVSEADDLLGV